MRTHRAFPALQPWAATYAADRDLLTADRLVSLRVEPIARARRAAAVADLHFADGVRRTCVPLVYVDLAQLDLREADPLVFPECVAPFVDDDALAALLERVFPALESRALRGGFWSEELIVLQPDALVAAARAQALFGAAALAHAIPGIAAAAYARRFTAGKHVVTHGASAAAAAAFVRAGASSVAIANDAERDATASAWYGVGALSEPDPRIAYAVAVGSGAGPTVSDVTVRTDGVGDRIVTVAATLGADALLVFDDDDAPVAATFGVTAHRGSHRPPERAALPAPVAVGGSAGRVAIVVRADAGAIPDADTDEAAAFAEALRAEGFTVAVTSRCDALDDLAPDLVHLFGVIPGTFAANVADWALEHRVPLAVHAYFEAPAAGGYWGAAVAPYCFGYSPDDRNVRTYLGLLARRAVEVDGVTATAAYAPPAAALESSARVLRVADVVFVHSEREADAVAALRPGKATLVVPPLAIAAVSAGPLDDVAALAGVEPVVLVHAPIGPEANQLLLARAIAAVGVPAVFAGPIADPIYAERVREFAPDSVRLIGEPRPAAARGLYRAAAVFADASWVRRGVARVLSAAALGAEIVVPGAGWVDVPADAVSVVDPADVENIAIGIGEAWDRATRTYGRAADRSGAVRERLAAAHLAIVAGYAKIGQTV
jgi:hypothetical protein